MLLLKSVCETALKHKRTRITSRKSAISLIKYLYKIQVMLQCCISTTRGKYQLSHTLHSSLYLYVYYLYQPLSGHPDQVLIFFFYRGPGRCLLVYTPKPNLAVQFVKTSTFGQSLGKNARCIVKQQQLTERKKTLRMANYRHILQKLHL